MIPKKIHYCWFGNGEKSEIVEKCLNSWNKLEGFEIIEWNEQNCNLNENQFIKNAYKEKKWAFVSDYIRLKVLYEHGGIYLDTDVEILKNFNDEFLSHHMFISFMFNCNLSTAVIGAEKNSPYISELLNKYSEIHLNNTPNNDLFTNYFLEKKDFLLNNKFQLIEDKIAIYPKEYFECPTLNKKMGYSIHHFEGSWRKSNNYVKNCIKRLVKRVLGVYIYQNIIRYKSIKLSPFYSIYKQHTLK